jgi:uncharacterized protein with von Willebrand factor type A (vWA) domain
MDLEAKIADIQKSCSDAVSRMQESQGESRLSVIVETVDVKEETSETTEVDVVSVDCSASTSRLLSTVVEEPAHMEISPLASLASMVDTRYRLDSISKLDLAVLKMEKRRRDEEFQKEARRIKLFDHTYTYRPVHIEQRRLPLHLTPTPISGW